MLTFWARRLMLTSPLSIPPAFQMCSTSSSTLPASVELVEVGPRDGLQNERIHVSLDTKLELINRLADCGLRRIETTSFVSAKWVPQLADHAELMQRLKKRPGVIYSALTPNLKGLRAALKHQVDEVAVFGSASETFSRRNINCSISESLERFREVSCGRDIFY